MELQPSIAPPSTLRRLTDSQSASSAIAVAQNQLALQQNQLAVATQVPPDSPERALLRQQRDYYEEQAAWIADVAERKVYQNKRRTYDKLESALANYKEEFHQAAAEHRHRCQLEITAQVNQLAHTNEVERQQSEMIYQQAAAQANKASTRLYQLTNSENDAMQQLQVAETQLNALTDELHAAQDQSRQQQLQMFKHKLKQIPLCNSRNAN